MTLWQLLRFIEWLRDVRLRSPLRMRPPLAEAAPRSLIRRGSFNGGTTKTGYARLAGAKEDSECASASMDGQEQISRALPQADSATPIVTTCSSTQVTSKRCIAARTDFASGCRLRAARCFSSPRTIANSDSSSLISVSTERSRRVRSEKMTNPAKWRSMQQPGLTRYSRVLQYCFPSDELITRASSTAPFESCP